jgi:2-aminoethylphosphonate-pyruvate transaminase
MTSAEHSVQTAVILAAGMGTRLGKRGTEIPKGFLKLGDKTIIEESINKLTAIGITRIVIVTGHLASFYCELAARRAGLIETVHNPRYAQSGSCYSLWLALDHLAAAKHAGSFLLLESDLVYERRALEEVTADSHEDVILLSSPTGSGDEVWVETDGDGRLVTMSKDRSSLRAGIAGELVGITRVSPALAAELRKQGDGLLDRSPKAEYETGGLVAVATRRAVHCRRADGLVWAEIDDENHLARARQLQARVMN